MSNTHDRLLLRVEEAARLADISRSHAYQLINTGTWPAVRMHRSVRVPAAWLDAWIAKHVAQWEEARRDADETCPSGRR